MPIGSNVALFRTCSSPYFIIVLFTHYSNKPICVIDLPEFIATIYLCISNYDLHDGGYFNVIAWIGGPYVKGGIGLYTGNILYLYLLSFLPFLFVM